MLIDPRSLLILCLRPKRKSTTSYFCRNLTGAFCATSPQLCPVLVRSIRAHSLIHNGFSLNKVAPQGLPLTLTSTFHLYSLSYAHTWLTTLTCSSSPSPRGPELSISSMSTMTLQVQPSITSVSTCSPSPLLM